jgi:hypothetical protein
MKKLGLLFFTIVAFHSLVAQINNNVSNPIGAPNSGVQTPPTGPQTTGPDFQPTTPYIQTIPPITTPTLTIPSVPTTTPQIQTQPNTTTPNSFGTDNSPGSTPTNTLNPGAPISPPKK